MAKFTDIAPLTYYYMHGYKIMNPFCRIITQLPTHRLLLEDTTFENREDDPGNKVLLHSTCVDILQKLKRQTDSKGWALLQIDEETEKAMITGDVSTLRGNLIDAYGADNVPTPKVLRDGMRGGVIERLRALWTLCQQTASALAAETPATCDWVIRGDGAGAKGYFATQGANFVPHAPSWTRFGRDWGTNQFFSTSVGDELASVAGRAVIWVIRLKTTGSKGRLGGAYTSEAEVLFPYDVKIRFEGGVVVSAADQLDTINLASFEGPEVLRAKLKAVYLKNGFSTGSKTHFLVAKEV